ncbi:unnamed protein product [Periconia digitata]|uniref:Enoyl reductase (ER) domain-containing protein n=1 Tax=Periconia digitata TaxID=1303443 RepID=A0A9W4U1C1_9PLEO|nr:unnamed protein product [Periconia digitata]
MTPRVWETRTRAVPSLPSLISSQFPGFPMAVKIEHQCLRQGEGGLVENAIIGKNSLMPDDIKPYEVLVRVAAVALNPTDHKSPSFCPTPGAIMGVDFAGVIVHRGSDVRRELTEGSRVCGAVHGSNPANPGKGSFAEYVAADSRLLLKPPVDWTDTQAAALGGSGWFSAGLFLYESLKLDGKPSSPTTKRADGTKTPILVYGAATATGTMICQILSLSGYAPVGVCSSSSADMVLSYGAIATIDYVAPNAAETIKSQTGGQLRHAIDCISSQESMRCCMAAMGRAGGKYVASEHTMEEWRTRRGVKVLPLQLAYETFGNGVELPGLYHREPSPAKHQLTMDMADEVQKLLDRGLIRSHPPKALPPGFQSIIGGLKMLKAGEVRGQKLVVCLDSGLTNQS